MVVMQKAAPEDASSNSRVGPAAQNIPPNSVLWHKHLSHVPWPQGSPTHPSQCSSENWKGPNLKGQEEAVGHLAWYLVEHGP